jgi:signal transduction histidine kinase
MVGDTSAAKKRRFFGASRQLEQDIEHITSEMYRRNVDLAELNKTLSLLQSIDELLLSETRGVHELCRSICDAIRVSSGFQYVALVVIKGATLSVLSEVSSSHLAVQYSPETVMRIKSNEICVDIHSKNAIGLLRSCRLRTREQTNMFLIIGYKDAAEQEARVHDKDTLKRLEESLGVVIENKMLDEENTRVLGQLKKSNEKLKALDEAKDEFISMASHQLRTPLTSIKGYLSMVLDGDVGEVSEQQKTMLTQAFTSSQRMVYLISDLLNVSRLQTGKFVIEKSDTYLPDVVEAELAQIKETATARGLTITYDKPTKFPAVFCDETKIRQVIMNFADNAVYYTPSGGTITVQLINKKSTVEYLVHDTGIGVPRALQHKLFSKFYRADNAQRARPDGTGLGLYMAKKVIIASGGNIIFKSKEGAGSTFGFSLPK